MLKRFNQLSFVIGLFFVLVAVVLLAGYSLTNALAYPINLYTGIGLLVFGVIMIRLKA